MSHFIVLVFTKKDGRDVDELLAPYDENIVMAPYVKYTRQQAIDEVRREIENYKNSTYAEYLKDPVAYEAKCNNQEHINYLKNKFPKKLNWTDDECYEDEKQWFDDDMVDSNGDLLSTYNPNSKWDWYVVGGRWSGYLDLKDGSSVDEAYVNEVDWSKNVPFAYVTPNGIWNEKGEMGWWACVSNEKDENEWKREFIEYVKNLDDDVIVTAVDCHI